MTKLKIPPSSTSVSVSIIDTGARISNVKTSVFLDPPQVGKFTHFKPLPAYSFLIRHELSGKNYLFDLSLRKDLNNLAGRNQVLLEKGGWKVDVPRDVKDILGNIEIDGIIWSHWHWDHTGDPRRFGPDTKLIVGAGFKEHLLPAYPANPDSGLTEDAFGDRVLEDLDFHEKPLKIGSLDAIDFFGDGSLYLLDAPGHAIGHICALARTTPTTFILMGGDFCHHPGCIRPTTEMPLPTEHQLPGRDRPCPGSLLESLQPDRKVDEPFFTLPRIPDGTGANYSRDKAMETRSKMIEFDADEDVLVIVAHDESLLDVLDFFPGPANDWKVKDWKRRGRWLFLLDLM